MFSLFYLTIIQKFAFGNILHSLQSTSSWLLLLPDNKLCTMLEATFPPSSSNITPVLYFLFFTPLCYWQIPGKGISPSVNDIDRILQDTFYIEIHLSTCISGHREEGSTPSCMWIKQRHSQNVSWVFILNEENDGLFHYHHFLSHSKKESQHWNVKA